MAGNPPAAGQLRRPVCIVRLNGDDLAGLQLVTVANNAHYSSDTFNIELSLQGQPPTSDLAALSEATDATIEVLFGYQDAASGQSSQLISAITGLLDRVEIKQPENFAILTGRDLSARLIETLTTQKYQNKTASEVATLFANEHGLIPQVTATTTPIGTNAEEGYAASTCRENEWDFLTALAEQEDFEIFIRGNTLYFQPAAQPNGPPYQISYQAPGPMTYPVAPVKRLTLSRELNLARDVIVTVTSHDPKTGKLVTSGPVKAANALRVKRDGSKAGAQIYTYEYHGLTKEQALQRAQKIQKDISMHERIIEVEMPGDPELTFDQPVALSGTASTWDQLYFLDRIDRQFSFNPPQFAMTLRAKNHSTASTVSLS